MMVSPRSTRRCLTSSMTSDTSSTTWSPCSDTAPVTSPLRTRTRPCCGLVFAATQKSAKASDARNSRTWRSISPLIAPARGPTRLQPRSLGDDTGKRLIEDRLDVDQLLERIGDLGRDRGLYFRGIHERTDSVHVARGVVQRALPPVRKSRGRRQQPGEHDAEGGRDRAPDRSDVPRRSSRRSPSAVGRTLKPP